MSLEDKTLKDMTEAMRRGDKLRRSVLSYLRSAIHYQEIEKQAPLTDDEVIAVIARQVKQRRESIEEFRKGHRPDLAEKEEAELAILQDYMPRQMSEEEIVKLARQVIQETGARGSAEKGKVMGRLMPLVRGKADGARVNTIVSKLLEEMAKS